MGRKKGLLHNKEYYIVFNKQEFSNTNYHHLEKDIKSWLRMNPAFSKNYIDIWNHEIREKIRWRFIDETKK